MYIQAIQALLMKLSILSLPGMIVAFGGGPFVVDITKVVDSVDSVEVK